MTLSGTRTRGLLVLPTCYIFSFNLTFKLDFFYCCHFEIRLLFQVTLDLKATIFKLMHKIKAIYLALKIRPVMTLTFKVTLSKKLEFSTWQKKYSNCEQDSFILKI